MPTLTLVRGDRDYFIEFEVRDADGEIVDLTDTSVRFKMQRYGESTLTFNKEGTILSGTLGLCQILIEDEFQTISGEFNAELEISWIEGKVLTAPDIYVKILKDLPR